MSCMIKSSCKIMVSLKWCHKYYSFRLNIDILLLIYIISSYQIVTTTSFEKSPPEQPFQKVHFAFIVNSSYNSAGNCQIKYCKWKSNHYLKKSHSIWFDLHYLKMLYYSKVLLNVSRRCYLYNIHSSFLIRSAECNKKGSHWEYESASKPCLILKSRMIYWLNKIHSKQVCLMS